jgi:hypothetical protein
MANTKQEAAQFIGKSSRKEQRQTTITNLRSPSAGTTKKIDLTGLMGDGSKKDKQSMLSAVHKIGKALEMVDDALKEDKEVVIRAVNSDGRALKFAKEGLQMDKEAVMAAVRNDGSAIEFTHYSVYQDEEVLLTALKQDGIYFSLIDTNFFNTD